MEVLHPRCAGLDVHSRRVNACVRIAAGRKATAEHREFATTTAGLLELAAWLTEAGCTHVAMEATGVYWKPVWHILEDESSLTLVLANAQHIRNVPGRKSDRNDAAWIADLLAHGLIRGSFVMTVFASPTPRLGSDRPVARSAAGAVDLNPTVAEPADSRSSAPRSVRALPSATVCQRSTLGFFSRVPDGVRVGDRNRSRVDRGRK